MKLYKYRSLEGDGRKYTEDLLFNGNLYFSTIDQFNDPFEFEFRLASGQFEIKEERYKQIRKTLVEELRVFCFSGSWENIALWSNYANSHKGICIEFDGISKELDVKEVKYSKQLPEVNRKMSELDVIEQMKQVFYTKQKTFDQESEFRVVRKIDKNGNVGAQINNVTEIIPRIFLGVNFDMKDPMIGLIKKHLNKTEVYKLEKSQDKYKLEIQKKV